MPSIQSVIICLLVSLTAMSCGGRSAVRPSPKVGADIIKPPTADRDIWQLPATVIELLEMSPGMSVIDLGAGDGYLTPHLSAAVGQKGKVHAVEIDDTLLTRLSALVKKRKLNNVNVIKGAIGNLPQTKPVDRILLLNTYPELADPVNMIQALAKRLKPGGWLVIIDYRLDPKVPGPPISERLGPGTIEAEARGAGLSLVATSDRLPRQYVAVFMRADEVSAPPPAAPMPSDATPDAAPPSTESP